MKYLFLPQITAKIEENKEFRTLQILSKNDSSKSIWNPLQWYDAFDLDSISHLSKVKSRFLEEISFKFESIEHEGISELDSGVKADQTTFEDNNSDSESNSSSEQSDFEEMDMPILKKILS